LFSYISIILLLLFLPSTSSIHLVMRKRLTFFYLNLQLKNRPELCIQLKFSLIAYMYMHATSNHNVNSSRMLA
jgi:hypothetical protein